MAADDRAPEERSIGQTFQSVMRDLTALVREEIALAKAELREGVSRAVRDVAFVAVGGFVAYTGLLALVAAAIVGLATVMAPWLAALLVGVVVVVVGGILLLRGVQDLRSANPVPERTIETLKEDADVIREGLR